MRLRHAGSTRERAWSAAAALLVALAASALLATVGCEDPARIRSGVELFRLQGCQTCHGEQARGSPLAPDIVANKRFWTRAKLVEYLRDPPAYIQGDPRLREQARRYSLPMTKFDMLRPEELEGIAQYVLDLE